MSVCELRKNLFVTVHIFGREKALAARANTTSVLVVQLYAVPQASGACHDWVFLNRTPGTQRGVDATGNLGVHQRGGKLPLIPRKLFYVSANYRTLLHTRSTLHIHVLLLMLQIFVVALTKCSIRPRIGVDHHDLALKKFDVLTSR